MTQSQASSWTQLKVFEMKADLVYSKALELARWILSSSLARVIRLVSNLILGVMALPAYTLKGVQLSSRNHKYRNEFNGLFGKRFIVGVHEYRKSTNEERMQLLRIWHEKGYDSQVKLRGELKSSETMCTGKHCPLSGCEVKEPHKHYVDGDCDIVGVKHQATV
jgi:hypothetical protein